MNVSQFSIIIKNVWNQLNLRNYSKDKVLKFDLCQLKDCVINETQVFIEVNSPEDILDILKHFNLAWNLKESDVDNMVKKNS
ncbi:hypothetical protein [Flavobacterium sp.]|uniref:hypothetical protein n=1 Tax=Flavobacterium sp. TaxID=239 RepID=UPI0035278E79